MADAVQIKASPDAEDNSPMPGPMDEDIYEDAGDLEFYDNTLANDPHGTMYLARVPQYVWDAWNSLDDDAEIQIGTIRHWYEPGKDGNPDMSKPKMRLLLRNDLANHQTIPKEYDLETQPNTIKSTFIFNERDLPGFKARNKVRAQAAAAGIPAHLLRQKEREKNPEEHQQNRNRGRRGRRQEYFRKAIPKKTAISGRIKHEMNCAPVRNPESEFILNNRAMEAMKPKAAVEFGELKHGSRLVPGSISSHESSFNFIKTAPPPPKVKKTELKTARMPENDLFDAIFRAFKEYNYWSLKALRQRIQQPEIYLRQTLEKCADLHRSGSFANHWQLKQEHWGMASQSEQTVAPAAANDAEDDDGDDEDADIKMEDVMPS